MKVLDVETRVVAVPLLQPTAFATTLVTEREYVIVTVHTDDGVTGTGFAVGGRYAGEGHLINTAIRTNLCPLVIGHDVDMVHELWQRMFESTILIGRRGAVLRGLSAIDIALWDARAIRAGLPLFRFLGGHRKAVPAYASGGYYREGKDLNGLATELSRYVDMGFDSVKIKVGRLSLSADVDRVRVARETVGPGRRLALDANNAWSSAPVALRAIRAFELYDPWWIEEPVMPDSIRASAEIARAIGVPVATGEIEATRWGFRALIEERAASIIQPDATVVGGVSEWMRIANMASGWDIPVAPHWMANLHVHLVAAASNGLTVEYFLLEEDVFNFERLVVHPLRVSDGVIEVPVRPGHGIELDDAAVQRFTVA